MKASKTIIGCCLCGLLILLGVIDGFRYMERFLQDKNFACDLKLRRNEVCCAHLGVNSFHLFEREQSIEGFCSIERPDKPNENCPDNSRRVHAYPPWHVAFFWFYGWMPELLCIALMSGVFCIAVYFIAAETYRLMLLKLQVPIIPTLGVIALITSYIAQCFTVLNYGVLLLALILLHIRFVSRGRWFCAGICWAIVMVKPQIGTLFFLPLLFMRRYKVLLTGILLCVGATCVMSLVYNESPVELVLQIPRIGSCYDGVAFARYLTPILGGNAMYVWMSVMFVLCACMCFLCSKSRDYLICCVPVALTVPLWTYSQQHDHVVLWIWYYVAMIKACSEFGKSNIWSWYMVSTIIVLVFCYVWTFLQTYGYFSFSGWGWVYRIIEYEGYIFTCFAFIIFVKPFMRRWSIGKSMTI